MWLHDLTPEYRAYLDKKKVEFQKYGGVYTSMRPSINPDAWTYTFANCNITEE